MKTFDLTFTPGETKVVPGGIFFVIISATDPIDVQYLENATNNNENASGVETGYFYENTEGGFTSARITSATAQTIKVAVSRGKGGYAAGASALTGGVIDTLTNGEIWHAGDVSVELGLQGFGYGEALGGGTTKSSVYLDNPAASGRNIYLTKLIINIEDIAAVATHHLVYLEHGVGAPGLNTGFQIDKRFTAFSIVGDVYEYTSAGAFGVQKLFRIRDGIEFEYNFNTPLKIGEGRYAGFGNNIVNMNTYCHFEWFERAV